MKIIRKNIWQTYPEYTDVQNIKYSFWNDYISYQDKEIWFNTYSGAIVVLNSNECSLYRERPQLAPDIFIQLGIMVPANLNEPEAWTSEYKRGKNDDSVLDLTILLTMRCQFKCIYCFEGEKNHSNINNETVEAIKTFIERRTDSCKTLHITWFGGEPLLEIKRIRELSAFCIEFCRNHNIVYYADVTTNGYALTPSICNILTNECHIKRYIITIDGPPEIHDKRRPLVNGKGTFDIIWKNIAMLVESDAEVTIRVTIDRSNTDSVKRLIDLLAKSKIAKKTGIVFVRTIDYSLTPDKVKNTIYTSEAFAKIEMKYVKYAHAKGLLEYTTPRPCPVGGCIRKGDVVIGTKGEIYKCLDTIGEKKWITGHITDDNEVNNTSWYHDWLSWEPSDSIHCKVCKLQPLCNGGCPHNALFSSKKHGTNEQCPDWKVNYPKNIQLYVEEKLKNNNYEEV